MRAPAITAGALLCAHCACAQTYPDKPIRLIVPFGPGGGLEIQARLISQRIYEAWRQPMVVDFRPGAASSIGTELVAKSPPDGYTLLLGVSNLVINPLVADVKFDAQRDFAPITLTSLAPQLLVAHASVPVRTLSELIALAHGERLTYASNGIGSVGHLAGELFAMSAGIRLTNVPYKGSGGAVTDLLGRHVHMMFSAPGSIIQYVKSGRLKGLAVTGSTRESEGLEDVPTFIESGYPTVEVYNWFGMFAPAATPAPVVAKLHGELVRILALPDVRARIVAGGYKPVSTTPDELRAFLRKETVKWAGVVRATGIRATD